MGNRNANNGGIHRNVNWNHNNNNSNGIYFNNPWNNLDNERAPQWAQERNDYQQQNSFLPWQQNQYH